VASCGGVDRAVFLFDTHAMASQWEWRQGRRVSLPNPHPTCDNVVCASCAKRGPPTVLPPPVWAALDATGKNMGWVQPPLQHADQ
jgi:hypothetical protein